MKAILEVERVTSENEELDTQTEKLIRDAQEENSYIGDCNPVCNPRFCCPETGWH